MPPPPTIRADARVASVAARLRDATDPVTVVDAGGIPVGEVTREAVADMMMRG